MKKILLLFALGLCTFVSSAIEFNIGEFVNASDQKTYDVDVRLNDNKIEEVYIYMATASGNKGYFNFRGKKLAEFYKKLGAIQEKYEQWSSTAKETQLVSFTKSFDIKLPRGNLFWHGTQVWLASFKHIEAVFSVAQQIPMIVITGSATDMRNRFITESFHIVFTQLKDFENFREIFNPEKALKKALDCQALTDKFK